MKRPTIKLEVHRWGKLSKKQRKEMGSRLRELADSLEFWGTQVSDNFTAEHP